VRSMLCFSLDPSTKFAHAFQIHANEATISPQLEVHQPDLSPLFPPELPSPPPPPPPPQPQLPLPQPVLYPGPLPPDAFSPPLLTPATKPCAISGNAGPSHGTTMCRHAGEDVPEGAAALLAPAQVSVALCFLPGRSPAVGQYPPPVRMNQALHMHEPPRCRKLAPQGSKTSACSMLVNATASPGQDQRNGSSSSKYDADGQIHPHWYSLLPSAALLVRLRWCFAPARPERNSAAPSPSAASSLLVAACKCHIAAMRRVPVTPTTDVDRVRLAVPLRCRAAPAEWEPGAPRSTPVTAGPGRAWAGSV
jgi:hypothetical protein